VRGLPARTLRVAHRASAARTARLSEAAQCGRLNRRRPRRV